MNRVFLVAAAMAVLVLGGGIWWISQPDSAGARVTVNVPGLSATARTGEGLFDKNCAACHGENAAGSDQGPPLIHRIYEPGHHGDRSFLLAARDGVRAHHWGFGNMPPVNGVSMREVATITHYIREVQRANGIN